MENTAGVGPLRWLSCVSCRRAGSSARSDLPLGIPKGDAWLVHESDRYGYKDFQSEKCLFRIKNADIQCGRIANPTEREVV